MSLRIGKTNQFQIVYSPDKVNKLDFKHTDTTICSIKTPSKTSLISFIADKASNSLDVYMNTQHLLDKSIIGMQIYLSGIQLINQYDISNKNPILKDWIVAGNTIQNKTDSTQDISIIYFESMSNRITSNYNTIKLCSFKFIEETDVQIYSEPPYETVIIDKIGDTVMDYTDDFL